MKTIIAGSRSIKDKETVFDAIEDAIDNNFEITEVVSGKADGVDSIGELWAEENDIEIKEFPYEDYVSSNKEKPAPLIRNDKMAEYADQAIIIWDGESNGTEYMKNKAESEDLKLHIHLTNNHQLDKWSRQ